MGRARHVGEVGDARVFRSVGNDEQRVGFDHMAANRFLARRAVRLKTDFRRIVNVLFVDQRHHRDRRGERMGGETDDMVQFLLRVAEPRLQHANGQRALRVMAMVGRFPHHGPQVVCKGPFHFARHREPPVSQFENSIKFNAL